MTGFLEKAHRLGQAMYLMGVHFRVANLIVTNLKKYTGLLQVTTPAATTFKWNPTLDNLATYFVSEIVTERKEKPTNNQRSSLQGMSC